MPITVYCKQCGKKMTAPDSVAGQRAKCKSCGSLFGIPHQSETEPPFAEVVLEAEQSAQKPNSPRSVSEYDDPHTIRRLSDYERISGVMWIVLGMLQILAIFTIIAGIWNIFAGITRIQMAKQILDRDPRVPSAFQGTTQLIIIGVINLVLGGVIGLLFVGFDFYIREQMLTNAWMFTGEAPPESVITIAGPAAAGSFDEQLRMLARLKQDGLVTEQEFNEKKRRILGI